VVRGFTDIISAFFQRRGTNEQSGIVNPEHCLVCGIYLLEEPLFTTYRVCPECRFHYSIPARQRINLLVDPKSFKERFRKINSLDPLSFGGKATYQRQLFSDKNRTGLTEASIVGECRIGGHKAILLLLDFSFLGGSIGSVVGEKVALACELAIKRRVPLVSIVTSGGVRIQEGALSLMQVAKTSTAVNSLHASGIPYIMVFANPTTGQAYASFANLADLTLAEPGALVGFAPLRLLQEMMIEPIPLESHTSEAHLSRGMVDYIVDREQLREHLAKLLQLINPDQLGAQLLRPRGRYPKPRGRVDPWTAVETSRHPLRPTARDYINLLFPKFMEIHGDRIAAEDTSIICGIGDFSGISVMVIGQQRNPSKARSDSYTNNIGPSGFHKAKRAMLLAAKFGIPVITLIDSNGPAITLEAEEQGLGYAIATTTATMADLPVPTIAVILNDGGRESALSFAMADRTLMLENAIYAPTTPEMAALLMYRDPERASDAARSLKLTAMDVLEMGIIDHILPEPIGGAQADLPGMADTIRKSLVQTVSRLQSPKIDKLLRTRRRKFRNLGEYSTNFKTVLTNEIETLQTEVPNQNTDATSTQRKEGTARIIRFPSPYDQQDTDIEESDPSEDSR